MVGFTIKPKVQKTMIDEFYNYRQGNLPTIEFTAEWSKLCIPFEESLTEEQE